MSDALPIEYLAARRIAETGLSAAELAALDMDEYARLTNRQTIGEVAAHALESANQAPGPQASQPAPAQTPDASQEPDITSMDWATYAEYRRASGIAARSSEGMSHASLSMADRWLRPTVAPSGRTRYYSGQ